MSAPAIAPPATARIETRPQVRAARPMRRPFRTVLFWSHLVAGTIAGVVVLIMSVTGAMIAYQRQMLDRAAGATPVTPPAGAARLSLDALVAGVRAASPGQQVSALTVRSAADAPVVVSLTDRSSLAVNPYTGTTSRPTPKLRAFFSEAERWHRSLALGEGQRSPLGTAITGACNLAFFFLILSGLYLWMPRRWSWRAVRAVLLFNPRATARARDWNWHHVLGIWCAPVLLLVVGTATFMSYQWPQRLVAVATGSPMPAGEGERGGPGGPGGGQGRGARGEGAPGGRRGAEGRGGEGRGAEGRGGEGRGGEGRGRAGGEGRAGSASVATISLDTLVARAAAHGAGWYSIQLRLPREGRGPVTATVARSASTRPDMRSNLTLDAATGRVLTEQSYATNDVARRVRAWVRPIHTGEVAGLFGQTLAALASLGGVVLVWTGFALAWRRLRATLARRELVDLELPEQVPLTDAA